VLATLLTALVDISRRYSKVVVVAALVLSVAMGAYIAGNIKINTDINQLLSDKLDWRQREKQLEAAFPQKIDNLVIVIDADTADKADQAAASLAEKLTEMPDKFTRVSRPDALPFFRANGLLFLSKDELTAMLDQVAQAQPMLATVITDPSLRGFLGTVGLMLQGAQSGAIDIAKISAPLKAISATVKAALEGRDKPLDWQSMMPQEANSPIMAQNRKYILTKPVLNYADLQPGAVATDAVRQAAAALGLTKANGVTVRLTGDVALNDEEFASVANGAGIATAFSALMVLGLLFLAMRTWRIVLPIALTLCVGLIASTAFATVAVGSLNLISVAFAVMFIGIAVDFGIQFGIRYRDQHHLEPEHAKALVRTASIIAVPLAMAAGSTALGFLSFIPTAYRGVSELGLIAGAGMIIAFVLNITLLPALMTLTKPPAEKETIGYPALAPLNNWLLSHRKLLLPMIALLAVAGLIVASHVRFDFDPLDLKNPKTESVSTMFDAMEDPNSDAYAAEVLTPSQQDAEALASKLKQLPEVDHTMTLASFVPEDQDRKLAMIGDTASLLAPTLAMAPLAPPTDQENLDVMSRMAPVLHLAGEHIGAAQDLATNLDAVVKNYTPDLLLRTQNDIVGPLRAKVSEINGVMQARPVALSDIPDELKRDWVTPDGKWLVEIFPKRDANNNPRDLKTLTHFIDAVQKVAPDVAGTPVSIRESGRTIVSAFVHAGIYGLVSIALLALVMLRRVRDVVLMLIPLLVAGILTLATITAMGLPLNYANIIALPLLLSLGVSYAVYFVFYWRSGRDDMLQSSMARAILFSAATVLVAFVSLCLSSHPGTRGMGVLLTIALLYSLICTFLMLPVLLGTHRTDKAQ
jgi:hopanoid biosynthesis associated RND transporter like protein HpnN